MGVRCSIYVRPHVIKIRAKSVAEYYLARSVIKGRVTQEIVMDLKDLGEKEPSTATPNQ